MKFSVANWHSKTPEEWLALNAYTTMAVPPPWAKEARRNESLFAPPGAIVFGHVSQTQYVTTYRALMRQRLDQIRAYIARHQDDHMIFLCACPDGKFCHRHLIAKLLLWLGCEEVDLDPAQAGTMKALSITQPWAQLIARGVKRYETRSWQPGPSVIGQRIAIHAAKSFPSADKELCATRPFYEQLWPEFADHFASLREGQSMAYYACHQEMAWLHQLIHTLPTGAVIATARLAGVYSTNDDERMRAISPMERAFGNYVLNRFAWRFDDVHILDVPVPARGALNLWNWRQGDAL